MCEYEFEGHRFGSLLEYKEFLLRGGDKLYKKYGDLVFTALESCITQEELEKATKEANKYVKAYQEAKRLYIDGEDVLDFKPPYIGVNKFLAGLTNSANDLLAPEFREFEYWKRRILEWKDPLKGFNSDEIDVFGNVQITESVTNDELRLYIDNFDSNPNTTNQILQLIGLVKSKWKALGELGTEIHEILLFMFTTIKADSRKGLLVIDLDESYIRNYINLLKKGKQLDLIAIDSIISYAKELKADLNSRLGNNLTFFPEFKIVSKVNQEIEGKGDTILGIIDLLVVDSNGNAHVIDYKTSPKDSFNKAKLLGFYYLLGVYHRMLYNSNIRTSDASNLVMVAPIKMENFRKVGDVWKFDRISKRLGQDPLEDITIPATKNRVAENLDEFLPAKPIIDLTPKELILSVENIMSKSFPDISTSRVWKEEDIKKIMDGHTTFDKKMNKWIFLLEYHKLPFTANSEAELFEKVKKYYHETLPKRRRDIVDTVLLTLKRGILENTSLIPLPKVGAINLDEGASAEWFKNLMAKYCRDVYEIVDCEAAKSYGIILIKNKLNNQIDILKVTTDNLDYQHRFSGSNSRTLITGAFETDNVLSRKPNSLALLATNGNIHLMETMAVLNCLPNVTLGGSIIGDILVINPVNLSGTYTSNELLIYNFKELTSHIEGVTTNIDNIKFASKVDLAKNKFKEIMDLGNRSNWQEGRYKFASLFQSLYTLLDKAMSEADRRDILRKLEDLNRKLEDIVPTQTSISLDSYNETENEAKSLSNKVILAIAELNGITFKLLQFDNNKWIESMDIKNKGVQSLMLDNPGNLNNESLNQLTKLINLAYLNVREDMALEVPKIRELVNKLRERKNFSKFKQMTTGNMASLYSNMIEVKDGDLLFKNPWDSSTNLLAEEREFLKYALTKINENRFPNSDLMEIRLTVEYFRVPLARGSFASESELLGGMFESLKKALNKLNPKEWWAEQLRKLLGVFSDEVSTLKHDDLFSMNNMFDLGLSTDLRLDLIAEKGVEYFETNLETLLLKHLFAYSTKYNVDLIMPMAKATMIHLVVLGQYANKKFVNSTNYVTDYIKSHIKNESLVPENLRNAAAVLGELKLAASFLSLAFSPVLYGYLIILGLWQDIRLNLTGDDAFTFENFLSSFKDVYRDMFKLGNTPTKCSLLNELMGVNDMDANVLADKLSSDLYGIFNFTNIAYHCASRPDFFNRMTIIVALMKRDGTWDAYSVKDGKLVYDWKKDARFSKLAELGLESNSTDSTYLEQKGLYYAIAELLEIEHARNADGTLFTVGLPLPKAYTTLQIESYKSVADEIYGYYSHEKKAMIHSYTIGSLWMQMKTYWSSKKNQYLSGPGVKLLGHYVLLKNQDGLLLYLKEENGRLIPTTEVTGVPLYKWEGKWQEGILVTLFRLVGKDSLSFHDLWYAEDEELRRLYRANIKLICYDLIMFLAVGSLITASLKDWDDELTKEVKTSGNIDDATIATAAHMAMKMVSSSFLDLNFVESIGSPLVSWEPMSFSFFERRIKDIADIFTGDKSIGDAVVRLSTATSNTKLFWDTVLL